MKWIKGTYPFFIDNDHLQYMGLLKEHVEQLIGIRSGLDGSSAMETCWLLSCKQAYVFDTDSEQTHHLIGDSRQGAYINMVKKRKLSEYAPFEKGYVYYVTRIGSDGIPEESDMRTVSGGQIWRQVKENRLDEPAEQLEV
jgi:hypothetical protein